MSAKSKAMALEIRGAQDAAPSGAWKDFGEYALAVRAARFGPPDRRLTRAASGLNETVGSAGGFAVPTEYENALKMRIYGESIAGFCSVMPMKSQTLNLPAIDETSRADGSRWGGARAYVVDEAVTPTASKPKFASIQLNTKKIEAITYAADELMGDVPALGMTLQRVLSAEAAFVLDRLIIAGNGAGEPLGILNSNAKIKVSKEVGQAAATITAENLITCYSRLWGASRKSAVWLVGEDTDAYLLRTFIPSKNAAGTENVGGEALYIPATAGEDYGRLLGRPVIPCEACNVLGTEGDIVLADLSQYQIGDRGLRFDSSIHVNFGSDETVFRLVSRTDGQSLWKSSVTPRNGGPVLSPFVTLADRS